MTRKRCGGEPEIECSVGGFLPVPDSGREVASFNVGWRFFKGQAAGADAEHHDDSGWELVNLPHGLEVLPLEASGGVNYQGPAWYRKHFKLDAALAGRRIVLHFEGLMGKSRFYINGTMLKEHFGGYLPCVLDVSAAVRCGEDNVIAVCVDNSDDPSYPPGKPQSELDFAYFGGIYRDVWMITTGWLHITDPNEVDKPAGGGVFIHCDGVSAARANVHVSFDLANRTDAAAELAVDASLSDGDGQVMASLLSRASLAAGGAGVVTLTLDIERPRLWHVDDPYLHDLVIVLRDVGGKVVDAVRLKIGIRSIEFRGREGFFLNGQPLDGKLIGVNRHQDYAYVGNAMPNNAHWRDAVKLREAGVRVIRCAHYPQDPAFMDACDALGMFVIITTPGWQFWNKDTVFEQRVFSDIRNMVRRDRNRPSAWLWEPILNETNYPGYFAERVHQIVHEEYPHPGCYTACDGGAAGQEHFDVVYAHVYGGHDGQIYARTPENEAKYRFDYAGEKRCVFTREWGDCPADWRAQASPSRVPKGWGERAQLLQAEHYADPDYLFGESYEFLYAAPAQHVGGALWHGTDHQRGYHADAFWGGILDATRQPKYSYYLFRSQVSPRMRIPGVDPGPFVHIAHLMHPTSAADVTVFSNCEEVRLIYNGEVVGCQPTHPEGTCMPRHPVVFRNAFLFVRHGQKGQSLEAQGLIQGQIVATVTRRTWDRRYKLVLECDSCGIPLVADGGDFVPLVARIVDKYGEVVRLTDDTIRFSVEGPAELIGGDVPGINPQKLSWGEAVVLMRAGVEAGRVIVRAESLHPGVCKPLAAELVIETINSTRSQVSSERPLPAGLSCRRSLDEPALAEPDTQAARLSAVEAQQETFMNAGRQACPR
jgi:beta-galactosidase